MKVKLERQIKHRSTNVHRFKGFGEKVRALRVSARTFLLSRAHDDTEDDAPSNVHQALIRSRELNLTEEFQAFQNDLGGNLQTTPQLILRESHVAGCLESHLKRVDPLALQPLLDILVAFANDLPQEFYQRHFYKFLGVLTGRLRSKVPEEIESLFLCLVSLFVAQKKYLWDDMRRLYFVEGYAELLSSAWPWYVNELASQTVAFLLHKLPTKEGFLGTAFRKLPENQTQGFGRVLASMVRSDVIQRLQSTTKDTLTHILNLLGNEEVNQERALESVKYAVVQMGHHVTAKHKDKAIDWRTNWPEDSQMVWPVFWDSIDAILPSAASLETSSQHLHAVLQALQILVEYKNGALVTDFPDTLTHCLKVVQTPGLPENIGSTVSDVIAGLLSAPTHQPTTATLTTTVSTILTSEYTYDIKLTFFVQLFDLPRFEMNVLPLVLQYLNPLVAGKKDEGTETEILKLLATLILHKRPPCKTGIDMESWERYPLDFTRLLARAESNASSIPKLIERKFSEGLKEDLSNIEDLIYCLLCLPHIAPLDYQDLAPYLAWILSDAAETLNDKTQKLVDDDTTTVNKKKKGRKSGEVVDMINIDLNVKENIPEKTKKSLVLLGLLIEAMSHVLSGEDLLASLSQLQLLEVLRSKPQYRENVHFLRALNFHFTIAASENDSSIISEEFLREFYPLVAPCLASPEPQLRLLAVHTLSLFPVTIPPPPENAGPNENLFQIMLRAESVAVTPFEYKDRLRFLSKLDADHVFPHQPAYGTFRQAPLLLCLGQLYINYRDVWPALLKFISSYAHTLPDKTFWPVWFSRLKITTHVTRELLSKASDDTNEALFPSNDLINNLTTKLTKHDGFTQVPLKPDYQNYRELLWKAMERFPNVCEARSRDLVPLFFNFLEQELFPADYTVAPTQNLKFVKPSEDDEGTEVDQSSEGEGNKENCGKRGITKQNRETNDNDVKDTPDEMKESRIESEGKETGPSINENREDKTTKTEPEDDTEDKEESTQSTRRAPIKALCAQLTLFSKFHNPRMLFQTKKLETMYQELLSHPSPILQRLSLDCLMTYGHPYLLPYKEGLYKILNDKAFKNALTLFSIDGSEQTIQEDHREGLMPYLMRILYGKMHFKTGSNSSGKSKITVRKATVLRFLAGARESELGSFLDLAFDVLIKHLDGSALEIVIRAKENLDLERVVPLSRLQGALTTLDNIIEKIGNLLSEKIPFLLKIVLYILNMVSTLLERREDISDRNVSFLKHLRQQAQRQLLAFFHRFADYAWSLEELDAVFETIVWPNLSRLPDEGLSTPVPLLSLFLLWSESPRYVPLLARHRENYPTLTPLPYIVKLLSHEKCSESVSSTILSLVENLLTVENLEPKEDGTESPLALPESSNVVKVHRQHSRDGSQEQSYSTALLTPHLDPLLASMRHLLAKLGKGQPVASRDLTILTSLTQWASGREISGELVRLIIPLVVKKHVKKEERVTQLLTICQHLLPIVEDSVQYLRPIISQFVCITGRHARDALCQSLAAIATTNPQHKLLAQTASDLNAWNLRMVDEMDFERRLACYKRLTEYFTVQESVDVNMCHLILYNCLFSVCHAEDASLRDVSVQCLAQLTDFCAARHLTHPAEVKQVISDKLLPQMRPLLRNEKEIVRMEMMSTLRHIVLKCHGFIDRLADLRQLIDETDDDLDFFLNSRHIQRHRRARALSKLAEKLINEELTLTTETLNDYIMPLATVYLFKDTYASDDYLLKSCTVCLGAVAKRLPWYPYQRLLRSYLTLVMKEDLKHLRQGVKILDEVINAFHEEVEIYQETKPVKGKHVKDKDKEDKETGTTKDNTTPKANTQEEKRKEEAIASEKEKSKIADNSEEMDAEEEKIDDEEESGSKSANSEVAKKGKEDAENVTETGEVITRGQKVYRVLVNTIIPQIQKTLAARTKAETEHKLNRRKHPEDEDIKRIPLAFALVKLLKRLPKRVLDTNINNVLMKIITFLKSKAESIREESRNMLVKIMVELGGTYLKFLVGDMQSILIQGFQSHVLVFTLHAVLLKLRPHLLPSHVDACMGQMINICKDDILGLQAEEKEVDQITSKVKEARQDKGYEILCFTAEFISTERLRDIIVPLRDVLADTQDKKVVNKMARCLKEVASGLDRNAGIPITQKSIFIYGMLNEKLTDLTADKTAEKVPAKRDIQRPDCFLLAPEPKRSRLAPKTSLKATAHILIDFSLGLLCTLMRRERFSTKETEHISLLDPFVAVATKCIDSEYPEVSMEALKCLNCLIKFPLPSLQTQLSQVRARLFIILNKFASPELARGKIYDLVQLSFKTLAAIIKAVESYNLNEEELRVLLEYVERNLEDVDQQQTAFVVLQAILARKIDATELHKLMHKVRDMSVKCSRIFALQQARITYYTYFLTYPMKQRKITFNILFFLGNISYSIEEGRFSTVTMLNAIIANFPIKFFNQTLESNLWFKISEQLVREESKENQALLRKALKTLFQRSVRRELLADLCGKLLTDENDNADFTGYQLAARSLSAFLDVPVKLLPPTLLTSITPLIIKLIDPAKYTEQLEDVVGVDADLDVREMDAALTHMLEVLTKLVAAFSTHADWHKHTGEAFWTSVQAQLRYPHIQVRLNACNLIGRLLASCPVEKEASPKFAGDTERARSLALDLCDVLKTEAPSDTALLTQLSLGVVRNLIYLVRHAVKVPLVRPNFGEHKDAMKNGGEGQPKDGNKNLKNEASDEAAGDKNTNKKKNKRKLKDTDSEPKNKVSKSNQENPNNNNNNSTNSQDTIKATGASESNQVPKNSDTTTATNPIVPSAKWILHRVGNLAYEELKNHGKEQTVVREALLNLIAGLAVIIGEGIKHPHILGYLIKHLARELSDENLPKALATRTQEVANLIKESIGLESYTRHLTSAQTALAKTRLQRRANEHQIKAINPLVAQQKKQKKHEARKESRKRKIADRKGKVVKSKKPRLKDHAILME